MKDVEQLVGEFEFFQPLGPEKIALVAGCGRTRGFRPGEMILREGEPEDTFYVVRHGSVAVEVFAPQRSPIMVETLHGGDPIGWSWIIPPHRARFDVRALDTVTTIEFDGACLRGKCEADPVLGFELMKLFAAVLAERLQHTRLRLLDVYAPVVGG